MLPPEEDVPVRAARGLGRALPRSSLIVFAFAFAREDFVGPSDLSGRRRETATSPALIRARRWPSLVPRLTAQNIRAISGAGAPEIAARLAGTRNHQSSPVHFLRSGS